MLCTAAVSPTAASWCHCGNTDGFGGFGLGQERLEGCRGGSSTRPRFFPIPGRKHQSYGVVKWYFLVTVLSIIDLKILLQFVCIDFKTFIFSAQMRTIHFPIHGPHICLHPDSPSRAHHQQWHSKRSEPNFSSPQLRWGSAHNLHKCIPESWSFKKKKHTTPPPNYNMEMGTFYFAIFKNQILHFSRLRKRLTSKYASVLYMEKKYVAIKRKHFPWSDFGSLIL